ncbi:WD repeat-containing protein 76 [Collichthys lucidus]|uniref:WD repeat-containing protein 76 n=1 Tax=Collichthys lucidus TaxID=240159 RepID=A0A4U5U7K4_COLLU|nr:WD repeat-containing protein 76 [Collichthys lucidus]
MTPVVLGAAVRRSSRNTLAPKRLMYSPERNTEDETQTKKRRTKTRNDKNNRKDMKEEDSDVGNSDVERTSDGNGGLSAYELERLENIRQNQAFLSSINLYQATEEFKQLTRPKPSQRGLMRSQAAVKEVLPARKSLRLQNKEAEILTLPPEPSGTYEQDSKEKRKMETHLERYRSSLKNMKITEDRVAKVVKDRIFSAAFHPCTSSLLMAAGDKLGKVGLWKLGGDWADDGVLLFEPHTRPVGCMAFSRAHPTHLLSLSYDGSLRCMDVEKAVFDDVYDIDDGLKTFDFMSHDCSTLVVGNFYGEVAIVDRRTPGNSHESLHSMDPKTLRCVSVHPLQRQYFAVAESKVVSIYDSRCLKKTKSQTVSQLLGHSLSISSAYFSPCTGNRVLTTCMDNRLSHDMHTGRWLTKLSAVWDPKQEDCFVVGSVARPRKVNVFHENGRSQHSFVDAENLNTVLSVTAFHPTRNALVGGNASGRLHVFTD